MRVGERDRKREGVGCEGISSHPAQLAIFVSSSVYIKFLLPPAMLFSLNATKCILFIYFLYVFFRCFSELLQPECVLNWNFVKLLKKKTKTQNGLQYFGRQCQAQGRTFKRPKNISGHGCGEAAGGWRSKSLKSASNHFALHIFTVTWAYLGPGRRQFVPLPPSTHPFSFVFIVFNGMWGGNISGISTVPALT